MKKTLLLAVMMLLGVCAMAQPGPSGNVRSFLLSGINPSGGTSYLLQSSGAGPTPDLVRDLLVTKSAPQQVEYEKSYGASANLHVIKK